MLFLNTRFPKTKKAYNQQADGNTDRLKSVMEKLVIQEQAPAIALKTVPQGGSTAWSYSERKKTRQVEGSQTAWLNRQSGRSKPKTFKLV